MALSGNPGRTAVVSGGTLPTYSPVAGQCASITSEVDGAAHLPPMKSLSYSVTALLMGAALPKPKQNENMFQYCGCRTSTRLLTRNSLSTGTEVSHHAHLGW